MAAVVPFDTRSDLSAGVQLGDRIAQLNACVTGVQAHFLELLREFDKQAYWEAPGFRSCAHRLNFKCGLGFNAARERLRVAHAPADLPRIRAAFAEGRISFSKVRAMTRVAKADNEDLLLNVACHGTAHHVERFVQQYRRVEKLGVPGLARAPYERRELTCHYDDDGCVILKARLPAEQGELIVRALERTIEQANESATGNIRPEGTPTAETAGDVSAVTSREREPVAASRADALCEMAESYLNHPDNAGTTADRYQVVVHVAAENRPRTWRTVPAFPLKQHKGSPATAASRRLRKTRPAIRSTLAGVRGPFRRRCVAH